MHPDGRAQRVTDVEQLAFLAGGFGRFSQSVVARLLAARALAMNGRNLFAIVGRERAQSDAERRLVALASPVNWNEIERALRDQAGALKRSMAAAGLLADIKTFRRMRGRAILPYLLLIAFGIAKCVVGVSRDRPVGFLVLLLILTTAFAILRWISLDRRTQAGKDAVDEARRETERLSIAPTMPETGLAVALYGPVVLAGSGFEDFHKLRDNMGGSSQSGGSCGSDGGGGGSCGGGGGCGGGCGGCGG
jgi:uncharacterized protein (TIGR04222 family)